MSTTNLSGTVAGATATPAANPVAAAIQAQTNSAQLVSAARQAATASQVAAQQAALAAQQSTATALPAITSHTYAITNVIVQGDVITITGTIDGGSPITVSDSVMFLSSLPDLPTLENYIAQILLITSQQTPAQSTASVVSGAVSGLGTFSL